MQSHFEINRERYNIAIKSAINWYIDLLNQCIDLDAIKENRLKSACQSKKTGYDGIVSIWNKNAFDKADQQRVINALNTAWFELIKVVEKNYQLSGMDVDSIMNMTDEELSEIGDLGIESDVARSVGEAKKFAEDMLHDISDAIDSMEAKDEILERKAQTTNNKLQQLRLQRN